MNRESENQNIYEHREAAYGGGRCRLDYDRMKQHHVQTVKSKATPEQIRQRTVTVISVFLMIAVFAIIGLLIFEYYYVNVQSQIRKKSENRFAETATVGFYYTAETGENK